MLFINAFEWGCHQTFQDASILVRCAICLLNGFLVSVSMKNNYLEIQVSFVKLLYIRFYLTSILSAASWNITLHYFRDYNSERR